MNVNSLTIDEMKHKADITMCEGEGCITKFTCYRFTAKRNEHRQNFFMESPIKNNGCEYYINQRNEK